MSVTDLTYLVVQIALATSRLKAATSLCRRHSLDLSLEVAQQLWLQILHTYVDLLRALSQDMKSIGDYLFIVKQRPPTVCKDIEGFSEPKEEASLQRIS